MYLAFYVPTTVLMYFTLCMYFSHTFIVLMKYFINEMKNGMKCKQSNYGYCYKWHFILVGVYCKTHYYDS